MNDYDAQPEDEAYESDRDARLERPDLFTQTAEEVAKVVDTLTAMVFETCEHKDTEARNDWLFCSDCHRKMEVHEDANQEYWAWVIGEYRTGGMTTTELRLRKENKDVDVATVGEIVESVLGVVV